MIPLAALVLGLAALAPEASEASELDALYFPLRPGAEWTYSDTTDGATATVVNTCGEPVPMGDFIAYPIHTVVDGQKIEPMMHAYDPEKGVLVIGYGTQLLPEPYTILKASPSNARWKFEGDTVAMGAPAPMRMNGRTKAVGKRTFNGQEVEAIEVTLETTIDLGMGAKIESKQIAIYGAGIGLLEMRSEDTLGKRKSTRSMKLTAANIPVDSPTFSP